MVTFWKVLTETDRGEPSGALNMFQILIWVVVA